MKTDIEIAREATMLPIKEIAEKIGVNEDYLEFYGKYKAKLSDEWWEENKITLMVNLFWLPLSTLLPQEKARQLQA